MIKIYVNLFPDGDYSHIIINKGRIPELKEYVANVDWLFWDYMSIKNFPILTVNGIKEKGSHLIRTKIVLQRIQKKGAEIFWRNKREDEWQPYIADTFFLEEEMLEEECKETFEIQNSIIKNDEMELYEDMIFHALKTGNIEKMKEYTKYNENQIEFKNRINKTDKLLKKEKIKKIWKQI